MGRAFSSAGGRSLRATIFAKGVSDSSCRDPQQFRRELDELRRALADCSSQGSSLVYLSSGGAVYGRTDAVRSEEVTPVPASPYGIHKLDCERLVRQSGVPYLVLRIPNVVGPGGNPHQLVPALVRQALAGRVTLLAGAYRDLIDVVDVVDLTLGLLERGVHNEVVNVASGASIAVGELFACIETAVKRTVEIEWRAGGDRQRFSVAKLARLTSRRLPYGPEYPCSVVEKYLSSILGYAASS